MDYPAILEVTVPGAADKRYVALTGAGQGRVTLAAPPAQRGSITNAELEAIWSGTAYVLWKDFRKISDKLSQGAHGQEVARLQQQLRDNGLYSGDITGYFGENTATALRKFQQAHRLNADGTTGAETLLFLYRTGKNPVPVLEKQKGT